MDDLRRTLLRMGAMAPFLSLAACMREARADTSVFGNTLEEATSIAEQGHMDLMKYPGLNMHGYEKVAMVCYDGMTMLDLVGPQYFLASMMGAKVHLVTKDPELKPITGDLGFAIVPDTTLDECPKDLDVLFVGGGSRGTVDVMKDDRFIDFIADRGARAKHVTSVCTGSIILGQAGLLRGKRATSHWVARDLLPEFGATPVNARVVSDGKVLTGAGVSAGLDFALALVAQLRGEPYAKSLQLLAEYAPEPPFFSGTPESEDADPQLSKPVQDMFAATLFEMKETAAKQRKAS